MSDDNQTYIQYRLQRAHEALEEAAVLWQMAHYNSYVSKLYYACFYAVSALLYKKGYAPETHTGTRNLFTQHFIKTNRINPEIGKLYSTLFHYRQASDYRINYRIDKGLAEPWLTEATQFVETIEKLIGSTEQ